MRTRSLAPLAITLTIILTSTICLAQHQQRPLPTVPVPPGFSQPYQPQTIVIPPPNPSGAYQESTVYNLNTGSMTLIRQEGNYTTIIQP